MIPRLIEKNLISWRDSKSRMPLIIRGARQTGKTTLIREFGRGFEQFIELNLEIQSNRKIFTSVKEIKDVITSIESIAQKRIMPDKTLIFIDEIQNCSVAIAMLRYFYEDRPDIHVISAGSLLEVRMKKEGWSFPVGRVEFLYLYPITFWEFLKALNEEILLEFLQGFTLDKKIPTPIHEKTIALLADYMSVGGMPKAVSEYLADNSFIPVRKIHESLMISIKEDFIKYANGTKVEYLASVWTRAPFEIGNRIKYSSFINQPVYSQYISKAFDILHDAMLVERIFPTTQTRLPLVKKLKSSPKTLFIDIGLCTYALNLTRDQIKERLIDPRYTGALFEQFVGQELLARDFNRREELFFWIREEKGAVSELDYILQDGEKLIPIEVKSGSHGSLKSLHQFLTRSNGKTGIRLYQGEASREDQNILLPTGESLKYKLISLPIYLTSALDRHYS